MRILLAVLSVVFIMALPAKLKADQHFTDTKDYFLEHLKKNSYALDPEAKAIVLYECANFSLINNVEGWYVKRHVRKVIKVLNKNGISEADVMVPFNRTDRSYIKDLKGKTYNLENNNVVIKEIDKSAVHVDVINSNAFMAKFSMPAVKEGSIIDYYYEIQESVGMVFAHWEFQEDIPKIYSEANAVYHDAFRVMEVTQTNKSFKQYEILPQDVSIDELPEAYMVTTGKTKGDYYSQKWVRRNISAMVDEPFVYNTDNYSELLELHFGGVSEVYRSRGDIYWTRVGLDTWENFNDFVAKQYNSFFDYKKNNYKVRNLLDDIKVTGTDTLAMVKTIAKYVREHFHYSPEGAGSLDKLLDEKKGSGDELVMLLNKLLEMQDINTHLVLLGTRDGLKVKKQAPLASRLDHWVCMVDLNGNSYFMDPSNKHNAFGYLPVDCYNGYAWVVDKKGYLINLDPSLPKEKLAVQVQTVSNDIADYRVSVKESFGKERSRSMRKEWQEDSSEIKKYISNKLKAFDVETQLKGYVVKGLGDADSNILIEYTAQLKWPAATIIRFQPSLFNYFTENPLKSEKRNMPVEMPIPVDVNFSLHLKLPEGYTVEEKIEPAIFKLDENTSYKYLGAYDKTENTLTFNSRLTLYKVYFDVSEYGPLKTFFTQVIDQQKKPVILKKQS